MYTVKVDGKPRTSVPFAHLARRFDDGERVLYNPDGKIETSRKDKTRPKGIVAVVTHVDASLWPPTYMITEVGKTGHRETEGGRLVAESLARGVVADAVARALVEREEAERREREAAAAAKAAKAEAKGARGRRRSWRPRRWRSFEERRPIRPGRLPASIRRRLRGFLPRPGSRRFRDGGREGNWADHEEDAADAARAARRRRAKARAEQEAIKAARAKAEKEAKNRAKKEAQKQRKRRRPWSARREGGGARACGREAAEAAAREAAAREEAERRAAAERADAERRRRGKAEAEAAKKAEAAAKAAEKEAAAAAARARATAKAAEKKAADEALRAAAAAARGRRGAESPSGGGAAAIKAEQEAVLAAKTAAQRAGRWRRRSDVRRERIDAELSRLGADDDLIALAIGRHPGGRLRGDGRGRHQIRAKA